MRIRGYCKRCHKWRVPADAVLGLEESAGYSPAVQDMAALLASKMPVEDASVVLEHLTGVKLPRATLDREARHQGQRAQSLRSQLDQKVLTDPQQLELSLQPYQMIIQLDAWNIRERDDWGRSKGLRQQGKEPERWHWVYTATCFRLDHRGHTAGGRPVITEWGFVVTRVGLDALREQLHAEALRRGLGRLPVRWCWGMEPCGFGGWPTTVGLRPANGWISTTRLSIWRRWVVRCSARTKPNSTHGSSRWSGSSRTKSSLKVIGQLEEALATMPASPARAAVARRWNISRSIEDG